MNINIATGASARAAQWKNEVWDWKQFVTRLSMPITTGETYAQYMKATKTDQAIIKDVGGYVGGYLTGGKRGKENVLSRSLIALDLDFAPDNIYESISRGFANTLVFHSTHKNGPGYPRFRLIMPLDRDVTGEEYQAISRKVAEVIGMEYFDPTTFDINRLMFWPSVSCDSDYIFKYKDGPALSADFALSLYNDWHNIDEWCFHQAVRELRKSGTEQQQDPLEKEGIVGAFCRAYTIHEAIQEFLPDKYIYEDKDRYTYVNGSTTCGAVIYDDKFIYSHHGTDPAQGELCNAFDIVRIHKFGYADANNRGGKPKSFSEMSNFARKLPAVIKVLAKEQYEGALKDFNIVATNPPRQPEQIIGNGRIYTPEPINLEPLPESEADSMEWTSKMTVDSKGKLENSANNILLILENDPNLKCKFGFNEFDSRRYVLGDLPWRKVGIMDKFKDIDFAGVRSYIERMYGVHSSAKVDDALYLVFEQNKFNPLTQWLDTLKWDGKSRINTLLNRCFNADQNAYTAAALRKSLVAAVARAYKPGTKFDMVLTLVGEEGVKKSTFLRKLGMAWFSDSFNSVEGRESFEQLSGAWIIEMGELAGLRRAQVEAIKHYITKEHDTYRPAYGRVTETFYRQCVFFATTNDDKFLKSTTGNRRWNPIICREGELDVFSKEFEEMIPQIWAEAKFMYLIGEDLHFNAEEKRIAKMAQDMHTDKDERIGMIEEYIRKAVPEAWEAMSIDARRLFFASNNIKGTKFRRTITAIEVWCECFGKNKSDFRLQESRELNNALRQIRGLSINTNPRAFGEYGRQRYYETENLFRETS